MVSNLLSNALKFSSQGTVRVGMAPEGKAVLAWVTDEGCGIPAHELERIFERFTRGEHTAKGAGLGLAVAKTWIEAHGGQIWAESQGPGKGATFLFTLPAS